MPSGFEFSLLNCGTYWGEHWESVLCSWTQPQPVADDGTKLRTVRLVVSSWAPYIATVLKVWSPEQHIHTPWESVGKTHFGASPQTYWILNSGVGSSNLCFNKPSRRFWGTLTHAQVWEPLVSESRQIPAVPASLPLPSTHLLSQTSDVAIWSPFLSLTDPT